MLYSLCCCCSVDKSCPTLCNPMDGSTAGFPVLHYLLEFAQTLVHWVGDAIQPFHPLSYPSPPAFNLSQHHGLFQWVGSLHNVAKILEYEHQHQFFQWIFRVDFLQDWLVSSPCSPTHSKMSYPAPQFESISSSVLNLLSGPAQIHTWLLEKPVALTVHTFVGKVMSLLLNTLSRFSRRFFKSPSLSKSYIW